jgi:hypothetical protein
MPIGSVLSLSLTDQSNMHTIVQTTICQDLSLGYGGENKAAR